MGNRNTKTRNEDQKRKKEKDIKYLKENTNFSEAKLEYFHQCFFKDVPDGLMSKENFCTLFEHSFNNFGQLQNDAFWKFS